MSTRRNYCSHHNGHHLAGTGGYLPARTDRAEECHNGALSVIHGDTSPCRHHAPHEDGGGESLMLHRDPSGQGDTPANAALTPRRVSQLKEVPKMCSRSPRRTERLRRAHAQSHEDTESDDTCCSLDHPERLPRRRLVVWGPDRAACLHSRRFQRPRSPSLWLLSTA